MTPAPPAQQYMTLFFIPLGLTTFEIPDNPCGMMSPWGTSR